MRKIEIFSNKSLILENVLMFCFADYNNTIGNINENNVNDDIVLEVSKMENQLKVRGAKPVGPLIQFSGADKNNNNDNVNIRICLMIQADRFLKKLDPPYTMEPVINVKNCMYTRFTGYEDDISFAYQKIQVEAYENEIKLNGNTYTVFLDSNEETGMMTADIFMEKADE